MGKTLPLGWQQNLNGICRYPQEHIRDYFEAIKIFGVTSYVPKSSKITDLAEARWFVFSKVQKFSQKKSTHGKPKVVNMDKLLPTDGAFLLHYLRSVVQTRTWYEATKARINHVNPREYGWKPLDEGFTAIAVEDDRATTDCVWMPMVQLRNANVSLQLKYHPFLGSV